MENEQYSDEVLDAVARLGVLRNPRRVPLLPGRGGAILEGEITIAVREATIRLVLDPSFPLTLPRFILTPWDALGYLPHVNPQGIVCYLDPEGLILNRREPLRIIEEAFGRVVELLVKGVNGDNRGDFADEFAAYWAYLPSEQLLFSLLEPDDKVTEVIVSTAKDKLSFVANDVNASAAFANGRSLVSMHAHQNAIYLPLEPGMIIIPPRWDRPFWNAAALRGALLPGLSKLNQARLNRLLKRRKRGDWEYVIVKLPRPAGGETMFGFWCDVTGRRHPLQEGGTPARLVPVRLDRLDRSYLVRRGGGSDALEGKRVLLIGCGSVGGHLAFELAHAGVSDLTVLDPDTLQPENTFRHRLGRRHWSQEKAVALKKELEADLPYIRVTALATTIEDALEKGTISLTDYDLVVLALGTPTVELAINEQLHGAGEYPPAIFTWLEPLGIGGHALLTGNGASAGCFECLYTPMDGEADQLDNRAAFAGPNQTFGRALTGCGSLHTPYGAADAVQTANLAARLALDVLTGKEGANPLLSWKGDTAAFIAEGFRFADRYAASDEERHRHRYDYRSRRCRVCGERRDGDGPCQDN